MTPGTFADKCRRLRPQSREDEQVVGALLRQVVDHGQAFTHDLVGFVIAAIGGFVLFSYHLRREALPKSYVVGHGTVAVVSFIILLLAIFVFKH